MNIVPIRTGIQCDQISEQVCQLVSSLCDLPHVLSHAHDKIEKLHAELNSCVHAELAQDVCDYLKTHVNYLRLYHADADDHTLILWHMHTEKFLNQHEWSSIFRDCWKAHVHLLMLHAQAHQAKNWDQEQSVWFKHGEICEILQTEFRSWLQEKYFDHALHLDKSLD